MWRGQRSPRHGPGRRRWRRSEWRIRWRRRRPRARRRGWLRFVYDNRRRRGRQCLGRQRIHHGIRCSRRSARRGDVTEAIMIGTLISIIVTLIIVGVIWWAIQQILPMIPLPEPFRKIIYVLLILILVL